MKLPGITEGERETLLQVLDYVIRKHEDRMGDHVLKEIDHLALKISRTSLIRLRTKLFPELRKEQPK